MTAWLKMIGASDAAVGRYPLRDIPSLTTSCRFPRDQFPGSVVRPRDALVYYAVGGWKRVFAVVDVVADPRRDVPAGDPVVDKRWPHAVEVAITPFRVDDLEYAPKLSDVSRRLGAEIHQGVSHIEMQSNEFERVTDLLRAARQRERLAGRARKP